MQIWWGYKSVWASLVAQWQRICLPMQKMQETPLHSLNQEDPLEQEMATHSSILAWRIPWTEGPGGYRLWKCKDIIEQLNTHTHQSIAVSILFFHNCLLIQTKLNLVQRILLKC